MAQIDIVVSEPTNRDSTWSHVFQSQNTIWLGFSTQLIAGNFFNGLQGQVQHEFDTQIPPGATILSATYELMPTGNNFNPSFDATISSPNRELQTQRQDAIQKPFELWEGYRVDQWSNAQVGALSTTFTAVFGTSVTTNASWILKQLEAPGSTIAMNDHLAQLITTRTGNMTIASLFWEFSRAGNPPGAMRVRIQGVTVDRGVKIPNGIDEPNGVSNDVLASSIPLVPTLTIFNFPINPTLVPLTEYFILIECDYPASNTDNISVYHQNQFLIANGGGLRHYGQGLGMDWQNFPGVVDLNQGYQVDPLLAQDIIWPIDVMNAGVLEVSPDLTPLVQAQIDAANYTLDSGILLTLSRFLPTIQSRRFFGNVTTPAVLRISYEEPVPPVIPDKLADPASSERRRHRIVEPWDPAYYRFKYGKDVPVQEPDAPEIERPNVLAEMLDQALLDELDARNAQTERDILELEAYVSTAQEALGQDLDDRLEEIGDQHELLAQLEINLAMARETLILALESRRKHQNLLAAIEAVIRNYY